MDLEALEAENDRGIAALSERVGTLRGITSGIHGEVESQHRLLDSMVRCHQCMHWLWCCRPCRRRSCFHVRQRWFGCATVLHLLELA